MNEQELTERIKDAARDYNVVPPTPNARIWEQINRERAPIRGIIKHNGKKWLPRVLAAAAILVLGIGIGRIGFRDNPPTVSTQVAPIPSFNANQMNAFRFFADSYLRDTEEFLSFFKSELSAGILYSDASLDARDLLSTTRLLLDTPVADDTELGALLSDLELILAQIAQITEDRISEEKPLITEGIEDSALMPRLRALLPTNGFDVPLGGQL